MRASIVGATFLLVGAGAAATGAAVYTGDNVSMVGSDSMFNVVNDVMNACSIRFPDFPNHNLMSVGGGADAAVNDMGINEQQIGPLSRALASDEYCRVTLDPDGSGPQGAIPIQGTTESLLVGLDGVAVIGNAATTCAPNGVATGGTFALSGGGTYTIQGSLDVLRILYGGLDHDGNYDCNGDVRRSLVRSWGSLFASSCAAGNAACSGGLTHVWRTSDLSATADLFVNLVGFPGRGLGSSPKFGPQRPAQNPFCNSIDANLPSLAGGASPVFPVCSATVPCPHNFTCDGAGHCNGPVCGSNAGCPTGFSCSFPASDPPVGVCNQSLASLSDFDDLDPIRIPCLPSDSQQSVCSRKPADGLGLLLPIYLGDTLDDSRALYTGVDCDTGKCELVSPNSAAQVTLQHLRCPDGSAPLAGRCFMPYKVEGDGSHNFQCRARKMLNHCFPLTANDDARCYNKAMVSPVDGRPGNWAVDSLHRSMGGAFFRIHEHPAAPLPCTTGDVGAQIACLTNSEPCSLGITSREPAVLSSNQVLSVDGILPTDQNVTNLLTGTQPVYPIARRLYLTTLVGFNNLLGGEAELAQCFGDSALVRPAMLRENLVPVPGGVQCLDYDERLLPNAVPLPGCGSVTNNNACLTNPPVIGPTVADVQAILNDNHGTLGSACVNCHGPPSPAQGLDLTNVAAVVGTASTECGTKLRIAPGNSAASYLVDKIFGGAQDGGCFSGAAMPLNFPRLSDYEISRIAAWIDTGAK
jgi:hypothetical protein